MKIAICVPHYGDIKADFLHSAIEMVIATLEAKFRVGGVPTRPQIKPIRFSSTLVQVARIALAEQALKWGADYILWADSDHSFPRNSLVRLLSHDVDVVGVNYPRRVPPHEFSAVGLDGKRLQPGTGLEVVTSIGMGLCLLKTAVFVNLPRPWFQAIVRPSGQVIGEDFYFFQSLRKAGFKIHVDHDLSAEIGHVGQMIYTAKNVRPSDN